MGKKNWKKRLEVFCLEDSNWTKDFPWNLLGSVKKETSEPITPESDDIHKWWKDEEFQNSASAKKKQVEELQDPCTGIFQRSQSWKTTILGSACAISLVLAGTGWAYAVGLHRQLQKEHEKYLMAETRADLLAANADGRLHSTLQDPSRNISAAAQIADQALQNTLTPTSLAVRRLMDIRQAASAYMIQGVQIGLNRATQRQQEVLDDPISLQGQVLTVLNMNGTREYLIQDTAGQLYMTYLEDDPFLSEGEAVYMEGFSTGQVGYVDENGSYSEVDEIHVHLCKSQS